MLRGFFYKEFFARLLKEATLNLHLESDALRRLGYVQVDDSMPRGNYLCIRGCLEASTCTENLPSYSATQLNTGRCHYVVDPQVRDYSLVGVASACLMISATIATGRVPQARLVSLV